ncbi:paralemmin-1 isoform X2 [Seriola lalandi dorsalis]|uniref:paralemmin-1 isoform X2 n=1 Tax=Seriola lalandi dorsalis TaxID=1841481 RepID=UPI000C6FA5E0|nr:paralemmin-1 isoform X2 [Seriola lalandi dorsalis]
MNRAVLDLDSDMEVSQALCQEDRLQLIAEKRKWQTEIENKKRQLEDDRRALQHLKSKALRERWLLDGQEQDEVKRQLEQDEAKTRSLEDTINRLEQELVSLETGSVCQTITHTTVSSGSDKAVEIKGHSSREQERTALSGQVVQEVKVHKSPRMNKPREAAEEMKRAMYSVEIKVERDRLTGETRVLSTNTTLPVDLSHQGVKVYEDEQKVVHEMNGEDGIHLLSSSEVEELIHKADEASMMSQTVATVTSLPTVEVQEEAMPESPPSKPARVAGEITGLEAKPGGEPSVAKASAENPVTMVFMGYQSVEDEAETKKVLGLQGTVTAELVLIDDANGKTSPEGGGKEEASSTAQTAALPPPASPDPPPTTKPPVAIPASNGETAGEVAGEVERGAVEVKKEKQLCKCCSIM